MFRQERAWKRLQAKGPEFEDFRIRHRATRPGSGLPVDTPGKSAAWKIRHANAFLKMDRGEDGPAWENARIAEAFGLRTRSLEKLMQAGGRGRSAGSAGAVLPDPAAMPQARWASRSAIGEAGVFASAG